MGEKAELKVDYERQMNVVNLAGKLLKMEKSINPIRLQNYYNQELGYRLPLPHIRLALNELVSSGFLVADGDTYSFAHKTIVNKYVEKSPSMGANPLYSPGI